MSVLDDLPDDTPVSVENSVNVYQNGDETSVMVFNWFGAGSAKLAEPGSDSSFQAFENIYDVDWIQKGNEIIMPEIEKAVITKTECGYEITTAWTRNDIRSTAMFKLSTATGYMELLRLQDRFAYLPDMPYRDIDLDKASRRIVTSEELSSLGVIGEPASWLHTVNVDNSHPTVTIALMVNGISSNTDGLSLYAYDSNGNLNKVDESKWSLIPTKQDMTESDIYEIHIEAEDNSILDTDNNSKSVTISALLVMD